MPARHPEGPSFEQDNKHVVYFLDLIRKFRYDLKTDKSFTVSSVGTMEIAYTWYSELWRV